MAGRNVRKLLLVLLPELVVAVGGHDKAYGMEKKLSVLRGMMVVLSKNCCWKRERELLVIMER